MIPWRLVLRNLGAHPVRSLLTMGSMFLATLLLCLLHSLVASLEAPLKAAQSNRLFVQSAVSLFINLPLAYENDIKQVEGVETVCKWQWFGGVYQDPENFFAQFGVDRRELFEAYPEIEIVEGNEEDFFGSGTAAIVGEDLAESFGWKIGDRIPIKGTIFARTDGAPWQFDLVAFYRSRTAALDNRTMFFDFHYLRKSLEDKAAFGPPGAGVYNLRVAKSADVTAIMREIDATFENDSQRVQTTTEAEFNRQFISMMGNIPVLLSSIGGGVLFAILVAVLNTMVMAGRERTRDIGIMKALGFGDRTLFSMMIIEGLLLCLFGCLLAIGIAVGLEGGIARSMGTFLPGYRLGLDTVLLALGLALGIGLLAGLVPAWQAVRLRAATAIRREG